MNVTSHHGSISLRDNFRKRNTVVIPAIGLAALLLLPSLGPASAQQPAAPATSPVPTAPAPTPPANDFSSVEIKTTTLGHGLYMLEGRGGNITVAVARDGILMIDGQFAPLHDKIRDAIRKLSPHPIKYLVNTHFHTDHTGGNAAFAKDGAVVVAHQNVKKRMESGTTNGLTGIKTPPAAADGLPTKTYRRALNIRLPGIAPHLNHLRNAHTDGDTYVWFKLPNVLVIGDLFSNARYPLIDFANGGSINGIIDGITTAINVANDQTKVVPGHGPVGTKADLIAYRRMLVTARDRIAALVKAGKSEADVVAAKPLADLDAKWGFDAQWATNFVRNLYHSLADNKPA